jgi:hypothetical protein
VPEELIQPKEPQIIPDVENNLHYGPESGIFNTGGAVDNVRNAQNDFILPREQEYLSELEYHTNNRLGEKWEIVGGGLDGAEKYSLSGRERVVKEFAVAIKDLDHEVGISIDGEGRFVAAMSDGNKGSIFIHPKYERDRITIHNHPSGACTPSSDDLLVNVKSHPLGHMTISHDGRFAYLERTSDDADYKGLSRAYSRHVGADSNKVVILANNNLVNNGVKSPTLAQVAREVDRLAGEWLNAHASEYGFIYKEGSYDM